MEQFDRYLKQSSDTKYSAFHPQHPVPYVPASADDVHRANIFYAFAASIEGFEAVPEVGESAITLQIAGGRPDSLVSLVLEYDHEGETFSTKLMRGDRKLKVGTRANTQKISGELVKYFLNPARYVEDEKSKKMSRRQRRIDEDSLDPRDWE